MRLGKVLALAAIAVLLAAPVIAAKRSLRELTSFLSRSDGTTDHLAVAAALDELRAMGKRAAPAAETLSALLAHRAPLYRDRDKSEVVRLRAYVLVTLSEIGFPASAEWALFDTLAHVDDRITAREIGAAARAARSLGPRARDLAPHLLDALNLAILGEEELTLERYAPDVPANEATTIQIEVVRALGAIAAHDDAAVLGTLRQLSDGRSGEPLDPRFVNEVRRAVKTIEGAAP